MEHISHRLPSHCLTCLTSESFQANRAGFLLLTWALLTIWAFLCQTPFVDFTCSLLLFASLRIILYFFWIS